MAISYWDTLRCIWCLSSNIKYATGHVLHPRLGKVFASWCHQCGKKSAANGVTATANGVAPSYYKSIQSCFGLWRSAMGLRYEDGGQNCWRTAL